MIVGDDQVSSEEESNSAEDGHSNMPRQTPRRVLVSVESAELLQTAGGGSLGKWHVRKVCLGQRKTGTLLVRIMNH
jgi:hypothetical protein